MKLAVVIPCRNEKDYIVECLEALYRCELPETMNLKVFVVDGLSTDGSRELVVESMSRFHGLSLLDNYKQTTPNAFNLGFREAGDSDYYMIVGARHILSPNYIHRAIDHLNKHPETWCFGGRIVNKSSDSWSDATTYVMASPVGVGYGNFRAKTESGFTDTVTSPVYPGWIFEKVGFFDEDLIRNQDDDFNYRVMKLGGKIYLDMDVSLTYYVRSRFAYLAKQMSQYGYWKVYVNRKHNTVTTIRQLVPGMFLLYLVLAIPSFFLIENVGIKLGLSFPLLLYLFLLIVVSWRSMLSFSDFFLKCIGFITVHISYGAGYLVGIWDFLICRRKKPSDRFKMLSR